MSLIALTLISSLTWVPVADKQALICPLTQLSQCLAVLPSAVRQQLPRNEALFKAAIGLRSAMVLPVEDSHFSGLILVNEQETPEIQLANIDGITYQLALKEQTQLTLWHELGHLENLALQGSLLPQELTPYQHEWLADLYLVWRIVNAKGNLDLAWQQYHRRNLAALTSSRYMSHWTSPMMIQVLNKYQAAQIAQFAQYSDFLADFYPEMVQIDPLVLREYSSLMQRTFGDTVLQPLPKYLFWRKPELGRYLMPTLILLMGEPKAHDWLAQHSML
ncbi:hypothetical protein HRJ35_20070 [Shewanella oneidensis MR-1]|uniref:Uncharacterized protein n=1 Tax=Shewanella oneidensis (strain ATCC 700550 / JCM 31522 / CIP 106686 / LMG 19005 / NCIMB 14063 / MR-1) TaxID=211586 RepID=Q8EAZ3_SHEON|nr:hypothetical protein [Shewanella oneidensis]AAN56727.1 uncharacterized protein SO_3744 [Shewanella oneidensis MR-1]MDX5998898.1 hypothetical protein [Shewanella oneidensis]MEE2028545.1 hypothetical protein [Shewanella oneidensis]QKG98066.1 hypothetical protein HRJ35_20070 [Shewanella oneidensis MR-1]